MVCLRVNYFFFFPIHFLSTVSTAFNSSLLKAFRWKPLSSSFPSLSLNLFTLSFKPSLKSLISLSSLVWSAIKQKNSIVFFSHHNKICSLYIVSVMVEFAMQEGFSHGSNFLRPFLSAHSQSSFSSHTFHERRLLGAVKAVLSNLSCLNKSSSYKLPFLLWVCTPHHQGSQAKQLQEYLENWAKRSPPLPPLLERPKGQKGWSTKKWLSRAPKVHLEF